MDTWESNIRVHCGMAHIGRRLGRAFKLCIRCIDPQFGRCTHWWMARASHKRHVASEIVTRSGHNSACGSGTGGHIQQNRSDTNRIGNRSPGTRLPTVHVWLSTGKGGSRMRAWWRGRRSWNVDVGKSLSAMKSARKAGAGGCPFVYRSWIQRGWMAKRLGIGTSGNLTAEKRLILMHEPSFSSLPTLRWSTPTIKDHPGHRFPLLFCQAGLSLCFK